MKMQELGGNAAGSKPRLNLRFNKMQMLGVAGWLAASGALAAGGLNAAWMLWLAVAALAAAWWWQNASALGSGAAATTTRLRSAEAAIVGELLPRFDDATRTWATHLGTAQTQMRDAIDQFAADKGRYPDSLEELASARYIREIPADPLANDSREAWVIVGPPTDAQMRGEAYDVRSGAAGRSADGRLYADW